MKLPNWLHRKPTEVGFDYLAWASSPDGLGISFDDPYLNSLDQQVAQYEANRTANATAVTSLAERWAKANETLFPATPMTLPVPEPRATGNPWDAAFYERMWSDEGTRTRGYWEGYAEATAKSTTAAYRVEVVRNNDGSGDNSIEEVLLHDAFRPLLHLERIDTDRWWMTLAPTGEYRDETTFDIFRVKKCIEVTEQ